MFRSESARERTLLRLIENQQTLIRDLADRLAVISGHPLIPPPLIPSYELPDEEEQYASALEGLPPNMQYEEE